MRMRPLAMMASSVLIGVVQAGCAGARGGSAQAVGQATSGEPWPTGLRGRLLLIGGGIRDENREVYQRFVALARECAAKRGGGTPRIVIATASSADEAVAAKGKRETIRQYCPECEIDTIGRETSEGETITKVGVAHAMFFTGGDQKRVTNRYLKPAAAEREPSKEIRATGPKLVDTPEATAMRALLMRGGVVAGTSAGEAMMCDPMFLTGRSTEALGFRSTRPTRGGDEDADEKAEVVYGPRIGQGMGFLPGVICDSHFFERDRFGRLVAALEHTGRRIGVGVGEDGCVEVDLERGTMTGVGPADALIVDVGGVAREGLGHRNLRVMMMPKDRTVRVETLWRATMASEPTRPPMIVSQLPSKEGEPSTSWTFFDAVIRGEGRLWELDGYVLKGWGADGAWGVVEIAGGRATDGQTPGGQTPK